MMWIGLILMFIAFALIVEALCALGDNYLLEKQPFTWITGAVRWVKVKWYRFAYWFADREMNYYLINMSFGPSAPKATRRRLFYFWMRRRVMCHSKLVELSHVE